MLIWEILTVALRGMWANKFRTFLTMFGIIVGVASVITLVATTQGLKNDMMERFESYGATRMGARLNHWRSRKKIPPNEVLTLEDRDRIIRECSAVKQVSAVIESQGEVRFGSRQVNSAALMGVDASWFEFSPLEVVEGQPFDDDSNLLRERVCVIGNALKESLFFYADATGKSIRVNGRQFRVLGVMAESEDDEEGNMIVMPFFTAQERGNEFGRGINLEMAARSIKHIQLAVKQVEEAIYANHPRLPVDPGAEDFEKPLRIWNVMEWQERARQESKQITILLVVMGSLSLFIGGIGLMNIMLFSVKERTREIGLRKALGASSSSILFQFISESMIICIGGGLLGTGLSYILCRVIARLPEESRFPDPAITEDAIIVAVMVTLMTGVFFGVWPASQAARLNPIEALRYE